MMVKFKNEISEYSGTSKYWLTVLGSANFGIILLLYRGCPISVVKLYCHSPVGTTQLVLCREVKCTMSFVWRVL